MRLLCFDAAFHLLQRVEVMNCKDWQQQQEGYLRGGAMSARKSSEGVGRRRTKSIDGERSVRGGEKSVRE